MDFAYYLKHIHFPFWLKSECSELKQKHGSSSHVPIKEQKPQTFAEIHFYLFYFFFCRSVIRTSLGSCHLVDMEVRTLTPLTTLLGTLPPMITVWLLGSWLKVPPRMAGHKMPMVTTVPAAIRIGQTKHTITSPLTWQSGSNNCRTSSEKQLQITVVSISLCLELILI